ncbi:MAG TPA: carboxymuconolactone decarboxylase family protein [Acetobacteraceae bacterium]|nr:carboxymuconolactone decarboxylase family protein [Acetobacteraceae bacterium]
MPRIPLVTEAGMTEEQRRVYEAMRSGPRRSPPVGPLAAAMHRPELAEKWSDLGLVLRFNSSFAPRLREFVILLTGRFWDCQFEWFSHEGEARKAGLSEQSIETLRQGGNRFAAADEQAIHDYATELLRDHRASDASYRRILDAYGTAGIVELTALIGYYAMVALTLNAHEIGVPEGVTPPLPHLPGHRVS